MLPIHYEQIAQRLEQYQRSILQTSLPKAAVLLLLVQKKEQLHIVFTQRAAHLNLHKGEVAFPGGKFDPEDDNLRNTVLRESQEEIGLLANDVKLLGLCSDIVSSTGIHVTPFVGEMTSNVILQPNHEELAEIFTAPVDFFLNSPCKTLSLCKQGRTINVPSFQFRQYHVWGLTALILVEFLNIIFDAGLTQFDQRATLQEVVHASI